ncbi:MAG: hypothetical protein AAB660_01500 [Patescibacteria group bacterium]
MRTFLRSLTARIALAITNWRSARKKKPKKSKSGRKSGRLHMITRTQWVVAIATFIVVALISQMAFGDTNWMSFFTKLGLVGLAILAIWLLYKLVQKPSWREVGSKHAGAVAICLIAIGAFVLVFLFIRNDMRKSEEAERARQDRIAELARPQYDTVVAQQSTWSDSIAPGPNKRLEWRRMNPVSYAVYYMTASGNSEVVEFNKNSTTFQEIPPFLWVKFISRETEAASILITETSR